MSALLSLRQNLISTPFLYWYRKMLPSLSETEREALEAGSVWWDASLFSGKPDWEDFVTFPPPSLSEKGKAFLDGPVETLCSMIDDWAVEFERGDLPEDVWDYMKKQGFFGMIIPEEYGGLGFSAYAHSQVVARLATRSITGAVSVMVPNSLGPGELLMQYGTEGQKKKYLPRLASGEEIPCFGLTSVEAGSDASAMIDSGVVEKGTWQGKEVLGIRLNFSKRYITLGPVSTLMGIAFKLYDPDNLLKRGEDIGITVALVPSDLPGVSTGRRHYPSHLMFQNGPIEGKDVFIPTEQVLGGKDQLGKGWKMLMGALAAGRGISLPSLSTAGAQMAARTTGAYARIRKQFGIPVGKFEGVQDSMARIGESAYLLEGARRLTCAGLDLGEKPAVISAIMKYHATERMRSAVNDAMDVHGGKGICDGPRNYLGNVYRAIPVGITVEGANILTRNMIIFGQGAIRCHPYLLREMSAAAVKDRNEAIEEFDAALFGHIGSFFANAGRSFWHNLTGGRWASAPARPTARYYRQLSRYAASLAIYSEIAMVVLGGSLKRKESLSARLGDVLSELYLLSGAIKRFEDDERPEADRAFLDLCFVNGLYRIETALDAFTRNFPGLFWRGLLRVLAFPRGRTRKAAPDKLAQQCAELLQQPGEQRDRLTSLVYTGGGDEPLAQLDRALEAVLDTEAAEKKLENADITDPDRAVENGIIGDVEAEKIKQARQLVREVLMVDDFAPTELTGEQTSAPRQHSAATAAASSS